MPVLNGFALPLDEVYEAPSFRPAWMGATANDAAPAPGVADELIYSVHRQAITNNQPLPIETTSHNGAMCNDFIGDVYNRIHIEPDVIDLGPFAGTVVESVFVWNAYFDSQLLNQVSLINADGVSLEGDTSVTYRPLESLRYDLTITPDGPATLGATMQWEFSVGNVQLSLLGLRSILWPFVAEPPTEQLEWKTERLTFKAGEQRIGLRRIPNWWLSFNADVSPVAVNRLQQMLLTWQTQVFAVPLRQESSAVSGLMAGDTVITTPTVNRQYQSGGSAVVWVSDSEFELVRIDTVNTNELTLAQPLINNVDSGSIMPVVNGRLPQGVSTQLYGDGRAQVSAGFRLFEMPDPGIDPADDYRGLPILTDTVSFTQSQSGQSRQAQQWAEAPTGIPLIEPDRAWAEFFQPIQLIAESQEDVSRLRSWLSSRRGSRRPFWLPSPTAAFVLQNDAAAADVGITVVDREYRNWEQQHRFMRDIQLSLDNGTVLYRRITGATAGSSPNTEQLSLDSALGVDLSVGQVRIVFLQPWLLNDRWTINHGHGGAAVISAQLEACLDDL